MWKGEQPARWTTFHGLRLGCSDEAMTASTAFECYHLFANDILEHKTSTYGIQKPQTWKSIDKAEFSTFVSLCLRMEYVKLPESRIIGANLEILETRKSAPNTWRGPDLRIFLPLSKSLSVRTQSWTGSTRSDPSSTSSTRELDELIEGLFFSEFYLMTTGAWVWVQKSEREVQQMPKTFYVGWFGAIHQRCV